MKKVARFACLAVALGVVAEVALVDAEPTAELGTRGMVEQALEWYLGVSGRINDAGGAASVPDCGRRWRSAGYDVSGSQLLQRKGRAWQETLHSGSSSQRQSSK